MKYVASIAVLALTLGFGSAVAQETTKKPGDRAARMQQFHTDMETAVNNSTLTQEQKDAFRKDLDTVRQAGIARKNGQTVDKEATQAAWKRVRSTIESDAIRAEDREKLEQNMKQMRKHGGKRHRGQRSPA